VTSRRVVAVLVVVLAFYVALVGYVGVAFIAAGGATAVLLGVGVLLLALLGVWFVVVEVRFGRDMQRLGRRLATEGGLPAERPVDLAAADRAFEQRMAEVERAPGDWRGWYRLAVAYDDARDSRRGRRAMRRAVTLERAERRGAATP
jgi:hypothetical protein